MDKLVDMSEVRPEIAQQRAFALLLPFISVVAEVFDVRELAVPLDSGIGKLCRETVSLYLDWIGKRDPAIEDIASMVQAVALSGDSKAFDV